MIILTVANENSFKLKADAYVVGTKYSLRAKRFEISEIKSFRLSTDKELYINMEKILHETELGDCFEYLSEINIYVDGIYYSDHALFMMAKDLGIEHKLIYNPGTLVTSKRDVSFYLSLGIKRVCLSREITLENILDIVEDFKDVEVIIHGKLNMFYSARNLLTNYFTYLDKDIQFQGELEEEKRDEHYPIIEDSTGSHVFHGKILSSFQEYDKLKNVACRIDSFLMDDDMTELVTNIYNRLTNDLTATEAEKLYSEKFDIDELFSGYYYKKTVYVKR